MVSRAIAKMDFAFYQGRKIPSVLSHVILRFTWDDEGLDLIAESMGKHGVEISPTSHLGEAVASGRVVRYAEETLDIPDPAVRFRIWQECASLHGKGYDFKLIALYMGWIRIGGKADWAQRFFRMDNPDKFVCSEFVTYRIRGRVPQIPADAGFTWTPETLFCAIFGVPSKVYFGGIHPEVRLPRDPVFTA
jgi:hypothetical protein